MFLIYQEVNSDKLTVQNIDSWVPFFSEGTLLLLRQVPLKVIIWKMYFVKVDIWDRFMQ